MLYLLFYLGKDRYALPAPQVVEVVPQVPLKQIPRAVPGVAGMFTYRQCPVPVIDLCQMALGRPSSNRLSTRILIIQFPTPEEPGRLLGLLAEGATETWRCDPSAFVASGVHSADAPYLGPVVQDPRGMVQLVDVTKLLSRPVQEALFGEG